MKCKNCNWPNRPNEKVCIKCGAPLTDDAPAAPAPKGGIGTMPLSGGGNPVPAGQPGSARMPVGGPQGPMGGPQGPFGQPGGVYRPSNMCPRCSYPLRPGMTECPNCHLSLMPQKPQQPQQPRQQPQKPADPARPVQQPGSPVQPEQHYPTKPEQPQQTRQTQPQQPPQGPLSGAGHQPTVKGLPGEGLPNGLPASVQPQGNAPVHRATVNIYTAPVQTESPKFSITPVARLNEAASPRPLDFEGVETILNRANTDPENLSITSRQQAAISRRDGKWIITDMSDQKTTFVHPTREGVELHDGDVILLGNRMFIFNEK